MTEYSTSVVELGDQIAALSPSKAGDLLAYLKQTYNIEPFGLPAEKQKEKEPEKQVEQIQTEFAVILTNCDLNNKVGLVKTYREISGIGLRDAMTAVAATASGTPLTVKEGISKAEAEKLKAQLEAANGTVAIK